MKNYIEIKILKTTTFKNKIKRIQEFKRKQSKYIIINFDFTTTKEIMLPR